MKTIIDTFDDSPMYILIFSWFFTLNNLELELNNNVILSIKNEQNNSTELQVNVKRGQSINIDTIKRLHIIFTGSACIVKHLC